ncbi:hypothetical protein PQ478_18985 [Alkalihalophilus pseudofirmus]|uniref:hypothetical protein n=1 Tax=Alkalihalophilus pseudofirmus TaxID=79885 RepID=UPI00259B8A39|nr:hypothetical protein [Alkalihalophilus pseudofirmus]WEG16563.1 hypothetical protein PQ478_18985 [Alkalihalophilus pseudofirmus]
MSQIMVLIDQIKVLDFTGEVKIRTNDEFRQIGDALSNMNRELSVLFNQLKAQSNGLDTEASHILDSARTSREQFYGLNQSIDYINKHTNSQVKILMERKLRSSS